MGRPRTRSTTSDAEKEPSLEFFKVFLSRKSSMRLVLPPAVGAALGRRIWRTCSIEDSQRNVWPVELGIQRRTFVMTNGWQSFADHHLLADGDFLHFEYNGKGRFKVKIYDKSGLNKYPDNESYVSNGSELSDVSERLPEIKNVERFESNGNNESNPILLDSSSDEEGAPPAETMNSFSLVVTNSTRYCVNLPRSWLLAEEIGQQGKITLTNDEGKMWEVMVQRRNGQAILGSGWRRFVKENNIAYGDVIDLVCSGKDYGSLRVQFKCSKASIT